MEKRNIGIFFILLSLLVWLADKMTNTVSTILGRVIYGDHYTQTANGTVGDSSYVFNINMHLAYSLSTVLILGIVLYVSSHKRESVKEF